MGKYINIWICHYFLKLSPINLLALRLVLPSTFAVLLLRGALTYLIPAWWQLCYRLVLQLVEIPVQVPSCLCLLFCAHIYDIFINYTKA